MQVGLYGMVVSLRFREAEKRAPGNGRRGLQEGSQAGAETAPHTRLD